MQIRQDDLVRLRRVCPFVGCGKPSLYLSPLCAKHYSEQQRFRQRVNLKLYRRWPYERRVW